MWYMNNVIPPYSHYKMLPQNLYEYSYIVETAISGFREFICQLRGVFNR